MPNSHENLADEFDELHREVIYRIAVCSVMLIWIMMTTGWGIDSYYAYTVLTLSLLGTEGK